jgi:MFS family permease
MSELTNFEKIRRLPWQIAGNAFNVVFWVTAAAGSVFILFLNEIGLDKARIGFLLSLLPFCGVTAIFTAPYVARFGLKRVFLLFFGARKIFAGTLLFTPLIVSHFGLRGAFIWVACAVLGFALCRAIAETAIYPWSQEMIPDSIRGKFNAFTNTISQILCIATVALSGYIIGQYQGLNKFIFIIAAGIVAGILSVWCFSFVPGGKPVSDIVSNGSHFRGMFNSLRDINFRRYMIGLSLVTIGAGSFTAFLPLFMKEQIGISPEYVVWLDIAMYAGALLSSFIWGWASDRFGSKPVMLSGPYLMLPLPLLCFILPRNSGASIQFAMVIYFLQGIGVTAWGLGLGRYLCVNAVPRAKKTPYMAVFYAGAGIMGGIAPILAGQLIKHTASINTTFMIFHIDSYSSMFAFSSVLLAASIMVLSLVRSDGALPMRRFVGIFLQGNPLLAVSTLLRYYRAPDEESRVSITEQLGYANNPMNNHELIEALNDPSFNVRYEAIIAIAHCRPDPELIDALMTVLGGSEPDLSVNVAWALGRLGDRSAIVPLREMLHSEHALLRARSARALATLGDTGSIPIFIDLFRAQADPGLRIAYAQSIGKMRCGQVVGEMLAFLKSLEDEMLRYEMTLALARILGDERRFITLWRQLKTDFATNTAIAILDVKNEWLAVFSNDSKTGHLVEAASSAFAQNEIAEGSKLVALFLRSISKKITQQDVLVTVISECAQQLEDAGSQRKEYLLLALHAAEAAAKYLSDEASQG